MLNRCTPLGGRFSADFPSTVISYRDSPDELTGYATH